MSIWIPPDSDFARSLSEPNFATPNKKPTGEVRIDWNHPLTRGLVRAVVSGNQELVRNIPIENSGVELTANKFGPEYLYDIGSNDSLVLGESPVSGSQPRTVLSAYRNVDADATYSTLCSIDNGGAGSNAQRWTAWISSGFFRVEIQGTGDTSTLAVDNADNEQTFWGVRQAGSNLSSTTVYINNQSETLTGTTTINTNASYILRVGQTRTDFTDRSLSGGLLWFYFWDRALSELEIAEIKSNPYQILKPANDTPYLFLVAGGGGVSQELTGNSSASAVGTLGVSAEANVSVTPTGVAGSSAVGTLGVTAEINASAELSGVAATSAVGTLTAEVGGGTTVALSGVDGTAAVGTLTAAGQVNEFADLLGNSATGAVGTLIVVTGLQVALSGNAATGAVGTLSVTAEINTSATLTGVGSSGAVGTLEVTVPITASAELTGVGATGAIGTLTAVGAGQVWTEVPATSTTWTEIS